MIFKGMGLKGKCNVLISKSKVMISMGQVLILKGNVVVFLGKANNNTMGKAKFLKGYKIVF